MLTGIQDVDQETLMKMLKFNIKNGGNLMTFGPAGIGKTEMAIQACKELNYEYVYLNLSVLEAPDLMGLPMVDEKGETPVSRYALPAYLPTKDSGKKPVVLLVDEADKAKPELQNPMLELFQQRSINGTPLNVHAVVATGNLPDENAFSQQMSHALMNRCLVYRVTHAFDPWRDWAVSKNLNPLVVGFLSQTSELLLKPPPKNDDTAYCHPSPRAWSLAARDIDAARDANEDIEFLTILISGRVGVEASVKFRVWLEHYRYIAPSINELVKSGKHPDLKSADLGRVMVCAISSVDAIMRASRHKPSGTSEADHMKEVHRITKNVMLFLATLPGETQIAAVKSAMDMDTIKKHKLTEVPEFIEVYKNIRKVLKMA